MQVQAIEVTLKYRVLNSTDWQVEVISPEDYFDLEQKESAELDSLPRFNHAAEYLDLNVSELRNTQIKIFDRDNGSSRIVTETFWNNGNNRLIERIDENQEAPYWEFILESKVNTPKKIWEIVRIGKEDGILIPYYQGFFEEHENGSQTEIKIYPEKDEERMV